MSLKIHHLNCGTMCPVCAKLVNGEGGWLSPAKLVCHVLLIETPRDGLVLVDTGFGQLDVQTPQRLGRPFLAVSRPQLALSETAAFQVTALGFKVEDVRHVIVTHLDLDHAGGLPDFPLAKVHVFQPEFDAAMHPDLRSKARYLPSQWAHSPRWVKYDAGVGQPWFGLNHVQSIQGLEDQILLVPLIGHTRGHCGIAVKGDDGWLLHCGDAYFSHKELTKPSEMPLGLRFFEELLQTDRRARVENLKQLQRLQQSHGHEIQLFCAHDPVEFQQY
ncbi:MBL fold metallo-hydrolase [Aquirhabdus sp.]|uniref:MBL fold metallo-hydrolase n=1 Tax=Aquirhabdus sp. TaxID=2824160 RepID=UPI00396CA45B